MSITILEIEQNSEEWLKAREGKVTGSIADNLLTRGLDEALKQNYSRFRGNFYTKRGHILEEEAIEVYEGIHDCTVQRPGMVLNDKYPNAACSPDGIDDVYLLEVKCFSEKNHTYIKNVKTIPFKIMAQLQFNMMITGLKLSKLVMYNPEIEDADEAFKEFVVKADSKIQGNMARKLQS
jgi:hypothetical protein